MSLPEPLPYRDEFEKHGETGVRFKFAGKPGEIGRAADVWLAEQQAKREEEAAVKRDAREEETLAIAKSAKDSVRYDRYIAITAVIIATIAAHKEIKWLFSSFMLWLSG